MKWTVRLLRPFVLILATACGDGVPQPKPPTPVRSASSSPSSEVQSISTAASDPAVMQCGELEFPKPPEWEWVKPAVAFRTLQYRVPHAAGDGELIVSAFAIGDGGGVQANIDRWQKQFQGADGMAVEVTKSERTVAGIQVTRADCAGLFLGMGMEKGKPGMAQLGAIVQGPQQMIFIRLIGPQATVDAWRSAFERMIDGLVVEK